MIPDPDSPEELVACVRQEFNAARHSTSDAVAQCHVERGLICAIQLDRLMTGGAPLPPQWTRPRASAVVIELGVTREPR